jgi:hypothetical protein
MLASAQVEKLICLVAALDRPAIVSQLHAFQASFPVDFTEDFLRTVSLDRLRHIFVALCLQQQRFPKHLVHAAA